MVSDVIVLAVNIDECADVHCVYGVCIDGDNDFTCHCIHGYEGVYCEIDTDDCEQVDCNQGTCFDHVGNFTCLCPAGFDGEFCESQPRHDN